MPGWGRLAESKIFWLCQTLIFCAVIGLVLFGSAGRFDIAPFWEYLFVCTVTFVVAALVIDPALYQERARPGGQPLKLRYYALLLPLLVHWCIAGFDVGRFHWSDSVPETLQVVGLAIFALALGLMIWAMRANRFFSSVI